MVNVADCYVVRSKSDVGVQQGDSLCQCIGEGSMEMLEYQERLP